MDRKKKIYERQMASPFPHGLFSSPASAQNISRRVIEFSPLMNVIVNRDIHRDEMHLDGSTYQPLHDDEI